MAEAGGEVEEKGPAQDPVIEGWMALPYVTQRAAAGRLATVGKELNRQSVADNAELLEPLIEHYGSLSEVA